MNLYFFLQINSGGQSRQTDKQTNKQTTDRPTDRQTIDRSNYSKLKNVNVLIKLNFNTSCS